MKHSSPDASGAPEQSVLVIECENSPPLSDSAWMGQTQVDGLKPTPGQKRFGFLSAARDPSELGWLGSYRIRGVLGEGGMGVVFDAEDSQLCRRVALKILKPELALTPKLRERFLQEARSAAGLPSDHVVSIYHIGSVGEVPYLAMQFLEGESLEQCLQRVGRLPAAAVARLGRETALGLAAAHDKGLIHRDIKPANIWLETVPGSPTPRVKLLDFGLARVSGAVSNLTAAGTIVGTPQFLAPEQARGHFLDERCDLFSLGCVLYRAVTGVLPFDGPDMLSLLTALAIEKPRPIHELAPETPEKLAALILELLAKLPCDRPSSAREVAERLRGLEGAPTVTVPAPVPVSVPDFRTESPTAPRKGGASRFATGLLLGGILTSMMLVLGAWSWIKVNSQSTDPNLDCSLLGHPIPVGVLESPSGPLASLSSSVVEATKLAIDEINEEGGVLGSRVEPIFVNGPSDESAFAEPANRLILENHVCALFGCCSAVGRKRVLPIVEKHNNLLFYAVPCEGLEESPNIVYVGAAPNQQILPGLQFVTGTLRKRRLFLIGSDTIESRTAHALMADVLGGSSEAQIVGEALLPLDAGEVHDAVTKIAASKADAILNTIAGDTNVAFFRALRAAGLTTKNVATLSFHLGESEFRTLPIDHLQGDYVAGCYFPNENRPENTAFFRKFQKRFGTHRLVTDVMESAYVAVRLWARAATEAGDPLPASVRPALRGLQFNGPGGSVRIDPTNQYASKVARVAQIGERGQFKIVSSSEEPVPPQPFPPSRKREDWLRFVAEIQHP